MFRGSLPARVACRGVVAAAAAAAIACPGRAVEACSCGLYEASRLLIPTHGTTGFPTDGRIRIFLKGFPPALRKRLGEEYRLRDPSGALVPTAIVNEGTMLALTPRAPLRPRSRYVVERVFAYESGSRLSDQERGYLAFLGVRHIASRTPSQRSASVSRFWFPDAWFETGSGPERKRSEAPTIVEASLSLQESNCGPGPTVLVRYRAPGLVPTDVLAVERKGGGTLRYFPQLHERGDDTVYISNNTCSPDPEVVVAALPFEVRLTTVSASGQRIMSNSWVTARVDGKPPRRPATRAVTPVGGFWRFDGEEALGIERWFSAPAREPPGRQEPTGPEGCPWGFESRSRVSLDSGATQGGYGPWEPVAVAWKAGAVFVVGGVFDSSEPGHLLSRAGYGPVSATQLPGPGRVSGAVLGGGSLILGMADRTPSPPSLERVRPVKVRLDGKPLWRQVLGGAGYNSSAVLAWTPQRTLLCWSQSPPNDSSANRIVCALLSTSDGRIVRPPFELRSGLKKSRERSLAIVNAAVAVDGGFVVAWRPASNWNAEERGVALTRLDDRGNTRDTIVVGEADARFMDLVRTSAGAVAAWDGGHAGVELAWLGPDGRPKNGVPPRVVRVSDGTGHDAFWPRLSVRGEVVATTWRLGLPTPAAFVAAADASGAVSPALEIAAGRYPREPVITADGEGFVVAYGLPKGVPELEFLRCRTEPPLLAEVGAPQRLAPRP